MNTRKLGFDAESKVMQYLTDSGFEPIARNYTTPYGEADIITKDNDTFVFTEVKARKTQKYGKPAEAVTKQKKLRYLRIAQYYFMSSGITDFNVRFDVAEVYISNGTGCVNYIKNAFDFTDISDFY